MRTAHQVHTQYNHSPNCSPLQQPASNRTLQQSLLWLESLLSHKHLFLQLSVSKISPALSIILELKKLDHNLSENMAVSHEKESTCSQLKLIKTHGFIATGAHLITELQILFLLWSHLNPTQRLLGVRRDLSYTELKWLHAFKAEHPDVPLTSGHSHVGSHLEAGVNVDDCAPNHIAGKVPWDKLHGSSQIISGLVALLCAVVCG